MTARNVTVLPWNGRTTLTLPKTKRDYRLIGLHTVFTTGAGVPQRNILVTFQEGGVATFAVIVSELIDPLIEATMTWASNLPPQVTEDSTATIQWHTLPLPQALIITEKMSVILSVANSDPGDSSSGLTIVRDFVLAKGKPVPHSPDAT